MLIFSKFTTSRFLGKAHGVVLTDSLLYGTQKWFFCKYIINFKVWPSIFAKYRCSTAPALQKSSTTVVYVLWLEAQDMTRTEGVKHNGTVTATTRQWHVDCRWRRYRRANSCPTSYVTHQLSSDTFTGSCLWQSYWQTLRLCRNFISWRESSICRYF